MSLRKVLPGLLLVLTFVMALPASVTAQRGNIQVTLTPTEVAFPTPGMADFDTGWVEHPGLTVSVRSRPAHVAWEIRLHATDPALGGYGKPLGDMLWRVDGAGPWQPLSTQETPILQGTGDAEVSVQFRMRLDWDADLPGDYGTGLTFTAIRP